MSNIAEEYVEQRLRLISLLDATVTICSALGSAWTEDGKSENSIRLGGKVYTGELVDFVKSVTDAIGNASTVCEEAKSFIAERTPETFSGQVAPIPVAAEASAD